MAKDYGILSGEAPEREKRRTTPRVFGVDNYSPAGETETVTYFGDYDELYPLYMNCEGTLTERKTLTLTRAQNGQWTLKIETTVYEAYSSGEADSGTDGGDGGAAETNTSQDSIQSGITCSLESILLHPDFRGLDGCSDEVAEALHAVMHGARLSSRMRTADGTETTVRDVLKKDSTAWKLWKKYLFKGVTEYYVPHASITIRTPVRRNAASMLSSMKGAVISQPPGVATQPGFNWLLLSDTCETTGNVTYRVRSYIKSAKGGWDSDLYKS